MRKLRIYLDNCCFNRPYDDQSSMRIKLETDAKLFIQEKVLHDQLELVWSYILEYENELNPFDDKKNAIRRWRTHAVSDIEESETVLRKASDLLAAGIKSIDALHLACATEGRAKYFITTDDGIANKSAMISGIAIINPVSFVNILEETK